MLVAAVAAILAAACGPLPEVEVPGESPKRTLQLVMTEPGSIDPATASGAGSLTIVNLLFEPLTKVSRDGVVAPAAAESWTISGDGRTFRFRLRSEAKWQSGKRLIARDFRYGWTRNLDPAVAANNARLLYPIAGARRFAEGDAEDDSEVAVRAVTSGELRVDLNRPSMSFLARTATWTFMPLPRESIEGWWNRWTEASHIDTNGPYRLVEWFHGESMKLVPNPHYWDSSRPRFDEIRVKIVDPEEAVIPLFRNQVADVVELDGGEWQALLRDSGDLVANTEVFPTAENWFLVFNTRKPPWTDARVRRAFSLAIDRTTIGGPAFSGAEQPSRSLVPRALSGRWGQPPGSPEEAAAEARRLLAEAGYPGGAGFPPVKLSYHRTSQWERLASHLVARWSDVLGVEVGLDVMEWRKYLDFSESPGDFDMYRSGWDSDYLDPESWHNALWHSGEDALRSGWSNAEYDSLVETADFTADPQSRREAYAKAQAILDAESPGIPIAEGGKAYMIQPYVTGVWASPLGGYLVFDDAIVERPE